MKFIVTMKDPDVLNDSIEEAVKQQISIEGIDAQELSMIQEHRIEQIRELCRVWFQYDEYLQVEIDTEAKTCIVIPIKEGS